CFRRRKTAPKHPASSCTPVLKFQVKFCPSIGLGGEHHGGVVGLAGALALAVLEAGAAVPQEFVHHLPGGVLAEACKEGVILPDDKAALAARAEPAFFPLGHIRAAVGTSAHHRRTAGGLGGSVGGVGVLIDERFHHRFNFLHKLFGRILALLDLCELRFPFGGHGRGSELFGHSGDEGAAFLGGNKVLCLAAALPGKKTFLYQLFDGSRSGGRRPDAPALGFFRHAVRAGGFHGRQQGVLGKVFGWGGAALFQLGVQNGKRFLVLHFC